MSQHLQPIGNFGNFVDKALRRIDQGHDEEQSYLLLSAHGKAGQSRLSRWQRQGQLLQFRNNL